MKTVLGGKFELQPFVGYNFGGLAVMPGPAGTTVYYSIGSTEAFPVGFDVRARGPAVLGIGPSNRLSDS